jgi:membrane associated rhomboid family serine protease
MFNSWLPESQDRLPLMWWKERPVYLTALIALVGGVSMIITAAWGAPWATHLAFSFESAFRLLYLWTPLTYVLVNPFNLWTLVGCILLWNFGEAVEQHLGRRALVRLLLLLILAPPLVVTLLSLAGVHGFACMGIAQLAFGLFVAFATLYPRAKISVIILTLDAWVLAAIFVGFNAFGSLATRNWSLLLLLAANVGTAYAFIRFETGELKLPSLPKRAPQAKKPAKKSSTPTVDEILDKISHQGMQSLTAEERRILDQASDEMKRRAG